MAGSLRKMRRRIFEHQQVGKDYSHLADSTLMFDAYMWNTLEIGDWFEIPKKWGMPDMYILWEIDHPSFNHDFVLVKYGGKRFIERVDK